jgi:orotate phosphoribosyltransferase
VNLSSKRDKIKSEMCEILARTGALKFGTFSLSGGRLSPYYIDLRIIPSYPGVFRRVTNFYLYIVQNDIGSDRLTRIAGIPTAGISLASVLAYSLNKPFLYVRKEEKTYGRERRVEGILNPGDRVLLVDDLITTGGNLISAAKAIISEGGIVEEALVLIDREESGKKSLEENGMTLHYLLKISEVAKILYKIEIITKQQMNDILKQVKKE